MNDINEKENIERPNNPVSSRNDNLFHKLDSVE